jgi:hypothetical protein
VKRGILIVALLLGGCTAPAAAPSPPIIVMQRHRLILPDGDWTVLITHSDRAAVSFVVIAFSGAPQSPFINTDPAVRTMTVTSAVRERRPPGPCLLTARHGRITALKAISRL